MSHKDLAVFVANTIGQYGYNVDIIYDDEDSTVSEQQYILMCAPESNPTKFLPVGVNLTVNSKVLVRPAIWVDTQGMKESIVRYHSTTEYTVMQSGERAIQSKERYTYDEYGSLTQYYVEVTGSYTRNYDYTNTYFMDQLIRANSVCTDYDDPQGGSESECYYSYDLDGRLIQKMHLTSGGAGTYEETWKYDDQGNLLMYVDQGLEREINQYVPLSQALHKSK